VEIVLETIRCGKCNRKLAEAMFTRLVIQCPRCKALNDVRITENYGATLLNDIFTAAPDPPSVQSCPSTVPEILRAWRLCVRKKSEQGRK
jgi:phage FluMu protein Com